MLSAPRPFFRVVPNGTRDWWETKIWYPSAFWTPEADPATDFVVLDFSSYNSPTDYATFEVDGVEWRHNLSKGLTLPANKELRVVSIAASDTNSTLSPLVVSGLHYASGSPNTRTNSPESRRPAIPQTSGELAVYGNTGYKTLCVGSLTHPNRNAKLLSLALRSKGENGQEFKIPIPWTGELKNGGRISFSYPFAPSKYFTSPNPESLNGKFIAGLSYVIEALPGETPVFSDPNTILQPY